MRGMQLDLQGLASRSAAPAAGAAAAITGAQGAALLTMSLRCAPASSADQVGPALDCAMSAIDVFAAMPARDTACFAPVAAALAMAGNTAAAACARSDALELALPGASIVLEEMLGLTCRVLAIAVPAAPAVPKVVVGDCAVAVELLRAAAHSAALLARSNAALFREETRAEELVARTEAALAEADRHAQALRSVLDPRLTR
jgi:formiminotetrahydrofolate cyclodeaminase